MLITGASGFLGLHLVRLCAEMHHEILGTVNSNADALSEQPNVAVARVDITDAAATKAMVQQYAPHWVFHLAGQSSSSRSWEDPVATFRPNVFGTLSLLEACSALDVQPRVVIASSSEVYGSVATSDNPIHEAHDTTPFSPYGASKLAQELLAKHYARSRGIDVIIVRPFLIVGPGRTDMFFSGSFARQVAEIEMGLHQPRLEVGNIDLTRDMTDVRDVAQAFMLVMEKGEPGETYNIASGQPVTIRSLLELMLQIAGVSADIQIRAEDHRQLEPSVLFGNPARLVSATGWRRQIELPRSASDMIAGWTGKLRFGAIL